MTKKKKIIIACSAVAVIIVSLILTLVLVNIKRYDNYTEDRVQFNNHTFMTKTNHGSEYSYNSNATIYKNGTRIVESAVGENDGKFGIYSYNTGSLVVDTKYDNISYLEDLPYATYFQIQDNSNPNNILIVDEYGRDLGITSYHSEDKVSTASIKVKDVDITSNKKGKINTKIESSFKSEKVEVSKIKFSNYMHKENEYTYEQWIITTKGGVNYTNIYSVKDGKRELLQTIGSTNGLSMEVGTPEIIVLSNGDIRFLVTSLLTSDEKSPIEVKVYDINYRLKGSSILQSEFISNAITEGAIFKVGDTIIAQASLPATSEDYDYIDTSDTEPKYFYLQTMKLSLKTGKITDFTFKHLIEDANSLNSETALLTARKIDNEKLENTEFLLINERTQLKGIDYCVDTLVRLNDERLIAYMDSSKDYNHVLLDNNLDLVCRLNNIDDYFSTNNAIIIAKGNNAYVCNMNGIVVASYNVNNIINLNHSKYYMVIVESTREGVEYQEYYLENLGYREKLVYHNPAVGGSNFEIDGTTYHSFRYYNDQHLSVMVKVIENSPNSYTYIITNYDGYILLEKSGIGSSAMELSVVGEADKDRVIVTFDGEHYTLSR